MPTRTINVARDFSRYPAGRYTTDGPFSGAAFRDDYLLPALRAGDEVSVELDGVRGYGSSFLEEAFGGLVRNGLPISDILKLLKTQSADKSLVEEIDEYIKHGNDPEADA
ncbi:MAG: STAS-like domain-containing protein [Proteobacteria bacterium]|nr:STAS-like domain-containing protein [Pseudomonadota bacterium]